MAKSNLAVIDRWEPTPVDELACCLNESRKKDLNVIMELTPSRLRLKIAMQWCEIETLAELIMSLGLAIDESTGIRSYKTSFIRWMRRERKMPFGMAIRLERLFGVPASLLCEYYV